MADICGVGDYPTRADGSTFDHAVECEPISDETWTDNDSQHQLPSASVAGEEATPSNRDREPESKNDLPYLGTSPNEGTSAYKGLGTWRRMELLKELSGGLSFAAAEPLPVENPAVSEDVVSVVVVEDPPRPGCPVQEEPVCFETPLASEGKHSFEAVAATSDICLPAPIAEDPLSYAAMREALEEVPDVPPSACHPPSHLSPVENPTADLEDAKRYTMVLHIVHDTETLTSMVCLDVGTKTAILDKAQAVYANGVLEHATREAGRKTTCKGKLVSVQADGLVMNLSSYDSDDLTFLIQTISNTSIPIFRIEILQ